VGRRRGAAARAGRLPHDRGGHHVGHLRPGVGRVARRRPCCSCTR
jgi:hypothetical protein